MPDHDQLLARALADSGCQTGTLHWLEPAARTLELKAHVGLPVEVARIVERVPVGKGMAGLAAERREPVQTCNLQSDPSADIRPGARAVPVQASIALPVIVAGELRGVLGLARADYHEWSRDEIEALDRIARRLGAELATGGSES